MSLAFIEEENDDLREELRVRQLPVQELIDKARQWAPCAMTPVFQKELITDLADALQLLSDWRTR